MNNFIFFINKLFEFQLSHDLNLKKSEIQVILYFQHNLSVGWVYDNLDNVLKVAMKSLQVSHNHFEVIMYVIDVS